VHRVKLIHFRGPNGERNFGDELGPWLCERLLPDMFDDNPDEIFVGIGTILNDRLPPAARVVVFGSGVGYGTEVPTIDRNWSIYCLRGPLSADALGVSRDLAITDPGVLVRLFRKPTRAAIRYQFSYMPHWRSACDDWRRVCNWIGFGYIDPCADVDEVLDRIQHTAVLVAEAMHGAIVADALRIPWIPVRSSDAILTFKWRDWCASLNLEYQPHRVIPAWPLSPHNRTAIRRARHALRLAAAAAWMRKLVATATPVLSDEATLTARVEALRNVIERFKVDRLAAHANR
jgi:succinoglycan biosynthesis protein ExoV